MLPVDTAPEQVDPSDLVSAMERTPGQVTFVSGQEELQRILAHPFAAWRTFLHPSQRKIAYRRAILRSLPGNRRPWDRQDGDRAAPRGLPGRTLAAPPATPRRHPGPPVLLTTFTSNLTEALDTQLGLLIEDAEVRSRIEVLNVDRLAYSIVRQARGTPVIADERSCAPAGPRRPPMRAAIHPVVPEERVGAGHPGPGPPDRGRVSGLPAHRPGHTASEGPAQPGLAGRAAGHRRTGRARQSTPIQLANEASAPAPAGGDPPYQHVIVDEAQDLHPAQWRLLRAAVPPGPDDLFVAADPHQRIYDNRVSLASLGINVRGRSRRLAMNYRTTQEILAWAVPLLGPDPVTGLDGEVDSLLGYRSPMHGPRPQVRAADTHDQELTFLTERIRSWLATDIEAHAIGVAARSARQAREARDVLKAAGIPTVALSGQGSRQAVRTGTMHGMKGLEFQAVAVCQRPSCGPRWWPGKSPHPSADQFLFRVVPPLALASRMR